MITAAFIERTDLKGNITSDVITLYPLGKALKLTTELMDSYRFVVRSQTKLPNPRIEINGLELITLKELFNDDTYTYKSDDLSNQEAFGLHVGYSEFNLITDTEELSLRCVSFLTNDKYWDPKHIKYLLEFSSSIEDFDFFTAKTSTSNMPADIAQADKYNLFLSIRLIKDLKNKLKKLRSNSFKMPERVILTNQLAPLTPNSLLLDSDLTWLSLNPDVLNLDSRGIVHISGLRFTPDICSQSISSYTHDIEVNRSIAACLYNMYSYIRDALNQEKAIDRAVFISTLEQTLKEIEEELIYFSEELKVTADPDYRLDDLHNYYSGSPDFDSALEAIIIWNKYRDYTRGNTVRAPIPAINDIFELFCFGKIVESFKNIGAKRIKNKLTTKFHLASLELNEFDIEIAYEPVITKSTNEIGYYTSNNLGKKLTPDFVVNIYKHGDLYSSGVLDAKFSRFENVKFRLSPEINRKYGLFLHRADNKPIDFVIALCPQGKKKQIDTFDYRFSDQGHIKPNLLIISLPLMHKSDDPLTRFFRDLLINSDNKNVDKTILTMPHQNKNLH